MPQPLCKGHGDIIVEPFFNFMKHGGFAGANFFFHFPQAGLTRCFTKVDPALWHLPRLGPAVDPSTGKDQAVAIYQENTDTGPIGPFVIGNIGAVMMVTLLTQKR